MSKCVHYILSLTSIALQLQGTRKVITSDILKAEDPDTAPEDLLYTVLHGKNEANRSVFGTKSFT